MYGYHGVSSGSLEYSLGEFTVGHFPDTVPYEYSKSICSLHIRLLALEVGLREESICFSLQTYAIDSTPAYFALSYTWGDPKDTVPVRCDGKTIHITRNLDAALRQLREEMRKAVTKQASIESIFTKPLPFWIDAVCINQQDYHEKSHQVRLMWKIYNNAHRVVAWLGNQDENSMKGVELLSKMDGISEDELSRMDDLGMRRGGQALSMTTMGEFGLPDFRSDQWDCLFHILTRQWFTRVWIIQELVASRECIFVLGEHRIPSQQLLRVGRLIEEKKLFSSIRNYQRERIPASNIASLEKLKRAEGRTSLLDLLWSTHHFKATNSRDRVFALLNLISGLDSESISSLVNYDLHPQEVFINTAKLCLHRESLDVLSYAQSFGNLYSLPSWVPHWGASDCSFQPMIRVLNVSSTDISARQTEECFRIGKDDTLHLEAKVFDRIKTIVKFPQGRTYEKDKIDMENDHRLVSSVLSTKADDTRNILRFHLQCLAEISRLYNYPTSEDLPDLYWRAYFLDDELKLPTTVREAFEMHIGGMEGEIKALEELSRSSETGSLDRFRIIPSVVSIAVWNLSKTIWKRLFHPTFLNQICRVSLSMFATVRILIWLRKLMLPFFMMNIVRRSWQILQLLDEHLEILTKAHNNLSGRDFCITDAGHIGWISRFAKEGDPICVFRGSRFPFVIHQVGLCHSRRYRLRGDCYIHGLMKENLFEKAKADKEVVILV